MRAAPSQWCAAAVACAGPWDDPSVCLRQSDQIVAILGDAEIARKCKLKCAGQTCSGYGGDTGFGMLSTQCHRLVEEPAL